MKITDILISIRPEKNLVAYANVVFDGCFVVKSIRIVRRLDGKLLVVMPNRYSAITGIHKDVCHPITMGFRAQLDGEILSRVVEMLDQLHHEPARRDRAAT